MNRPWDFDEEADEWARRHRTPAKEHMHTPVNSYAIELASRRGRVVLNREEWETLQRFLDRNEKADLKPADYEHLPAKVRLVVHDWVNS